MFDYKQWHPSNEQKKCQGQGRETKGKQGATQSGKSQPSKPLWMTGVFFPKNKNEGEIDREKKEKWEMAPEGVNIKQVVHVNASTNGYQSRKYEKC